MEVHHSTVIEKILDLARWAPSGDNTQPWWFEIIDERHVVIHGFDTREGCVYDLDGHGSQISLGALLETIDIAASFHHLRMNAQRRIHLTQPPDPSLTFDVYFTTCPELQINPLVSFVEKRIVQRRPMDTRKLTKSAKTLLESSLGEGYQILWLEDFTKRLQMALLMFRNAKLRLTMPEAYRVHYEIIKWGNNKGEEGLPAKTLGLDPLTLNLMRWVMKNWQRVEFFNTFFAGTLVPRIQMDLIPGIACAAHFIIFAERKPESVDDYVAAGRVVQRFWLTLTEQNLFMQPELTPLIFSTYVKNGISFSRLKEKEREAIIIDEHLNHIISSHVSHSSHPVFIGRIGAGPAPLARSERLPLNELLNVRKYHPSTH